MRTWHHVSHRDPCPICNKPDWCVISADRAWAICRRVDNGTGLHRVDKAGADYWLYCLVDHAVCQHALVEIPPQAQAACADPVTRDRVYRALLAMLPLSAWHRQALRQRGLLDVEIVRRGYRTLPLHGRAALARRLIDRVGPEVCATIPGLYRAERDGRRWWSLAGVPGLLIPVRNLVGHIVALKVRADEPSAGANYSMVSSVKHGGPGPGAQVHVPLHTTCSGTPVRITEGELKADIATVLSGLLTLAVPGVSVWRPVLPVLQQWQVRTVQLAFDADWRTNPHVARALAQAACALVQAGYDVRVETWDAAHGKGIDDVLAAGYATVLQPVDGFPAQAHTTCLPPQVVDPWQARIAHFKRRLYADPYFGIPERRAKGIPVAVLMYQETPHD